MIGSLHLFLRFLIVKQFDTFKAFDKSSYTFRKLTVEGQLEGPDNKIKDMKDWLMKTGSPSSRIDKAEFNNEKEIEEYTFHNFSIRR